MNEWKFAYASGFDARSKSLGLVLDTSDLYERNYFGDATILYCDCGELVIGETIDSQCARCHRTLSGLIRLEKITRCAVIPLACTCLHPWLVEPVDFTLLRVAYTDDFPVCPLPWRLKPDGKVTSLGVKYENLVEVNRKFKSELSKLDLKERTEFESECGSILTQLMRSIIGLAVESGHVRVDGDCKDTLLSAFSQSLTEEPDGASALLRSAMLCIDAKIHM